MFSFNFWKSQQRLAWHPKSKSSNLPLKAKKALDVSFVGGSKRYDLIGSDNEVNYNDQKRPSGDELADSCKTGGYHSILGDREKIRGTYREIVLFNETLGLFWWYPHPWEDVFFVWSFGLFGHPRLDFLDKKLRNQVYPAYICHYIRAKWILLRLGIVGSQVFAKPLSCKAPSTFLCKFYKRGLCVWTTIFWKYLEQIIFTLPLHADFFQKNYVSCASFCFNQIYLLANLPPPQKKLGDFGGWVQSWSHSM